MRRKERIIMVNVLAQLIENQSLSNHGLEGDYLICSFLNQDTKWKRNCEDTKVSRLTKNTKVH